LIYKVLENFKSYAGEKEIGPFHKCFSSVVGPNGSGKSNVIDAMLFVFGKKAKKLRLNKVSELIHQSETVKDNPPQFARVSVHFQEIVDIGDGDDEYRVVSDSDTVVTRIAKRDSSSVYKLNGKSTSFKEIAAYLNAKGIDLDNNRFLILQGEVEMISMMPPKGKTENDEGLLEYLEDIIGSSKFVEATNQAAEKVESLTELRQEKLNRVKAVEKEKDNLEGAKLEAESLLVKDREIRRKQNILFQLQAMKVEKELLELEDTKEKVSLQLSAEREALVAADKRVKKIIIGLSKQRKDYDSTFNELKRTKEEFSAFERKDIKLREEIKHGRAEKAKLLNRIDVESAKQTDAVSRRQVAVSRIPILEEQISQLFALTSEEEAKLDAIDEETKVITQKVRLDLETLTGELAPVRQERAVLQAALDTTETELKILIDSTTRAKQRLDAAAEELATIDETKTSKLKQISEREDEMKAAMQLIANLGKEDLELASVEASLENRRGQVVVSRSVVSECHLSAHESHSSTIE
jgi:structural maintenance of chromosome 4